MIHLFKSAVSRAVKYSLIGVVVVGLLIGAVRLALPFADLFRSELEGMLSETLGLQVRVGRLGLRLAGQVPQITLIDAELVDPDTGRTQLSLEQLRIELSLLASLRELAPHIESVTLVGAHLVIKRLADGTVALQGLEGVEGGDPAAMTFFLGNGRFLLVDSDLRWIDEKEAPDASPLHLSDVQIRFENAGEQHRFGILARPFGDRKTHLRLAGDLRGKPRDPADWSGEIFLHWREANLEQVLQGRLPAGLSIGSAEFEVEIWNDLEGGVLTQSLTRMAVGGLTTGRRSGGDAAAPMRLDRLEACLRWSRVSNGWNLDVKNLALTRDGAKQPESDLGLRFRAGGDGGWSLQGGSQLLDLKDVRDLLAQLPEAMAEKLGPLMDMRPAGKLKDLRFRFAKHPDLPPEWALSGRAEGLGVAAHGRIPGIAGLDTEFFADEHRGRLVLASGPLTLDLPNLLPDPFGLDELNGEVQWDRTADGALKVSADEITAGNADIATRSRFALSLPSGGGSPFLDLQTSFQDVELTSISSYIPKRRLKKKKLVTWLEGAFEGGRIPFGTLLFRGIVADYPFAEQQGRFQVLLGVEDGILVFNKDWPPLEDLRAMVHFLNRGMEVFVSSARFMDSDLRSTYASIPNLKEAVALEVVGRAEGPFAGGLRVLGETPLRKKLGAIADTFEAEGSSRIDLDMAIPLPRKEGKVPLRLSGELSWPGPASVGIAGQDIQLTDLKGSLHFDARSIWAESIGATLWGEPVDLHIESSEPDEAGKTSARIRADGSLPTAVLSQRIPYPIWGFAKGRLRWELRVDTGKSSDDGGLPPMDFDLHTDLDGVAVDLPAPLGKPATGTRRLHFSGRLARAQELQVRGGFGDLGIGLGLERNEDGKLRLARGTFNLGGATVPLPSGEGFYLSGSVPTLDLSAWLNWWSSRKPATAGDAAGGTSRLRSADVRVRRLLLTDMALNDVRLDLDQSAGRWDAKLSSRELDGRVSIPHRPRREPIRIALDRLDLKALLGYEGEEGQALAEAKRRSDSRRAHTLNLSVERLVWGDNPLGRVTLRTQAVPDGLRFADIDLTGPFMSIQGAGSWTHQGQGQRTSVSINAKGSDLGEFLRSLEFKSLFDKAPAQVDLTLGWPGGPAQFSAAELKGDIGIEVGAGRLLEVEPGVGRMLGILNLQALQRRLSLDFSDLFERGYAFEKISGKLKVGGGRAEIEELLIEGPSADVSVEGYTNLVKQEFHQVVTVTPRIGTGVALATAVAGGPLVGAAVFLADQVSGGIVDKLGSHQYELKGPWDKPEIRRGKLGGDGDQDARGGHFLGGGGRAGTGGSREPKPAEPHPAKAKAATERQKGVAIPLPGLTRDNEAENLFLQGH